jgi:hypothetical protein
MPPTTALLERFVAVPSTGTNIKHCTIAQQAND